MILIDFHRMPFILVTSLKMIKKAEVSSTKYENLNYLLVDVVENRLLYIEPHLELCAYLKFKENYQNKTDKVM